MSKWDLVVHSIQAPLPLPLLPLLLGSCQRKKEESPIPLPLPLSSPLCVILCSTRFLDFGDACSAEQNRAKKGRRGGGGTVFIGFVEGRGIERKTLVVRDESSDGKKGWGGTNKKGGHEEKVKERKAEDAFFRFHSSSCSSSNLGRSFLPLSLSLSLSLSHTHTRILTHSLSDLSLPQTRPFSPTRCFFFFYPSHCKHVLTF